MKFLWTLEPSRNVESFDDSTREYLNVSIYSYTRMSISLRHFENVREYVSFFFNTSILYDAASESLVSSSYFAFRTVFISTKFTEFRERHRTMDTNLSALEHRTYIRTRDTLTRAASNLN